MSQINTQSTSSSAKKSDRTLRTRGTWRILATHRVEYLLDERRMISFMASMSVSGMTLRSANGLTPGSTTHFTLILDGRSEPIEINGEATLSAESMQKGNVNIQFDKEDHDGILAITQYVVQNVVPKLEKATTTIRPQIPKVIDLANIYYDLGRDIDAVELLRRALEVHTREITLYEKALPLMLACAVAAADVAALLEVEELANNAIELDATNDAFKAVHDEAMRHRLYRQQQQQTAEAAITSAEFYDKSKTEIEIEIETKAEENTALNDETNNNNELDDKNKETLLLEQEQNIITQTPNINDIAQSAEFDEEVDKHKAELLARERYLNERETTLAHQKAAAEEHERALLERELSLSRRFSDADADAREQACTEQEALLAQNINQLEQQQLALVEQQTALDQYQYSLQQQQAAIEQKNNELNQKQTEIDNIVATIAEREQKYAQQQLTFERNHSDLEQREQVFIQNLEQLEQKQQ
ncbi:MAG: hypothetical protein JW841_10485, partial [Deltaproteobacteria bacterium]|nr:hypothetical protein [Deltaproteobacteria bacterium]